MNITLTAAGFIKSKDFSEKKTYTYEVKEYVKNGQEKVMVDVCVEDKAHHAPTGDVVAKIYLAKMEDKAEFWKSLRSVCTKETWVKDLADNLKNLVRNYSVEVKVS